MKTSKLLIILTVLTFIFLFGTFAYFKLARGVFERNSPVLEVESFARGLGLATANSVLIVKDTGQGLAEVVVRLHQRGRSREILRKKLNGEKSIRIELAVNGKDLELIEGQADLEVRAFDQSYWTNRLEEHFMLKVDYQRPSLTVVTEQHNAYQGQIELVAYQASDNDLLQSGVRVGDRIFLGFPARLLERSLLTPDLYLAFYPASINQTASNIRAFSEDSAGNTNEHKFYNKIISRKTKHYKTKFSGYEAATIKLFSSNTTRLKAVVAESASNFQKLQTLEQLDRNDLLGIVQTKTELNVKHFVGTFLAPAGVVTAMFGDTLVFEDPEFQGELVRNGYEFKTNLGQRVFVIADGQVLFSGDFGFYGNSVVVDHGLGIVSFYSNLGDLLVRTGDRLEAGQDLAVSGQTGFAKHNGFYLELLLQGESIDPRALWDAAWFQGHITDKVDLLKRQFGFPVNVSDSKKKF